MDQSRKISLIILVVAIAWILSGVLSPSKQPVEISNENAVKLFEVRVSNYAAQKYKETITITGKTQASRKITLRSQVSGRIIEVSSKKGETLNSGQLIALIDPEDRQQKLSEAKAIFEQRTLEYDTTKELFDSNFRSEGQLAEAKSNLELAKANLARSQLNLEHTNIVAPFDGILQEKAIEIGNYVNQGDQVAIFVDLNPILIVGELLEKDLHKVTLGKQCTAELTNGQIINGDITYISSSAKDLTRTFQVEIEANNSSNQVVDGITAKLIIPIQEITAHRVPSSLLTLDDEGIIGIKAVNDSNEVIFHKIEIVGEDKSGLWVTGLPEEVSIITVGQEYVAPGQLIEPINIPRSDE
mgnify:FL=1